MLRAEVYVELLATSFQKFFSHISVKTFTVRLNNTMCLSRQVCDVHF